MGGAARRPWVETASGLASCFVFLEERRSGIRGAGVPMHESGKEMLRESVLLANVAKMHRPATFPFAEDEACTTESVRALFRGEFAHLKRTSSRR